MDMGTDEQIDDLLDHMVAGEEAFWDLVGGLAEFFKGLGGPLEESLAHDHTIDPVALGTAIANLRTHIARTVDKLNREKHIKGSCRIESERSLYYRLDRVSYLLKKIYTARAVAARGDDV